MNLGSYIEMKGIPSSLFQCECDYGERCNENSKVKKIKWSDYIRILLKFIWRRIRKRWWWWRGDGCCWLAVNSRLTNIKNMLRLPLCFFVCKNSKQLRAIFQMFLWLIAILYSLTLFSLPRVIEDQSTN